MSLGARESAARESHAHVSLADLLAMPAMTGGGVVAGLFNLSSFSFNFILEIGVAIISSPKVFG